jgi:hypothetical protein
MAHMHVHEKMMTRSESKQQQNIQDLSFLVFHLSRPDGHEPRENNS